jgi:hypothetical protein
MSAISVWEEVEKIHKDYPNIKISSTSDSATFIRAAIANVKNPAVIGAILAVVILMIFLRSLSSTMIIGVAIPIAVISTFTLMYFYGFTLNTISFGGLALGVGMLVDNAIVVLENIFRHREQGEGRVAAALAGSREVAGAITASTLTTLAVFFRWCSSAAVGGHVQAACLCGFVLAVLFLDSGTHCDPGAVLEISEEQSGRTVPRVDWRASAGRGRVAGQTRGATTAVCSAGR